MRYLAAASFLIGVSRCLPAGNAVVGPQAVRYSERPELWAAIIDLTDEVWP